MLGRTVMISEAHNKEVSLNVEQLLPGIYLIKVNGAYAGKFVKQ